MMEIVHDLAAPDCRDPGRWHMTLDFAHCPVCCPLDTREAHRRVFDQRDATGFDVARWAHVDDPAVVGGFVKSVADWLEANRDEIDKAMWWWSAEAWEAMAPYRESLRSGFSIVFATPNETDPPPAVRDDDVGQRMAEVVARHWTFSKEYVSGMGYVLTAKARSDDDD
jgi:hypothetical protein